MTRLVDDSLVDSLVEGSSASSPAGAGSSLSQTNQRVHGVTPWARRTNPSLAIHGSRSPVLYTWEERRTAVLVRISSSLVMSAGASSPSDGAVGRAPSASEEAARAGAPRARRGAHPRAGNARAREREAA